MTIRLEGHDSFLRTVRVEPATATPLHVEMTRPAPPVVEAPVATESIEAEDPGPPLGVPVATWAVGGVAVASLATGIALAVVTQEQASEAQRLAHEGGAWRSTADEAQALSIGANVGFGVAAAAAITGAILYFVLDEEPAPEDTDAQITPVALPSGGGAAFALSF